MTQRSIPLSAANTTSSAGQSLLHASAPIWDLAFRPLFLLASGFSVIAVLLWAALLNSVISWKPVFSPVLWHIHEMVFGFALTVAAGFLLTAVQTWTNLRSLHGKPLMVLAGIWLALRVVIWQPWWPVNQTLMLLVLLLQFSWWALVIGFFARLLIRARSQRNYLFLPLLSVIACLNLLFIYLAYGNFFNEALHIGQSVILFFGVIVSVVAGRVIPMFTRNGCRMAGIQAEVRANEKLDISLLFISLTAAFCFLFSGWLDIFRNEFFQPEWLLALVGVLHLYRQSLWAPFSTIRIPLLWSLHGSYFFLGAGLVLVAISQETSLIRRGDAFHLITVGTLGGMILAMISRVSLGHTGRPLMVGRLMTLAFLLIFIGAAVRFVFPLFQLSLWGWNVSAVCWAIAFALFCYVYYPILKQR
ncbi:NnrS family protein [Bacterioplanoides sp.]|uniref:NnrS family protein n=1 Tax=Bacterioplanoides sp. TaxID=2066072 RepID=UPI003B5C8408